MKRILFLIPFLLMLFGCIVSQRISYYQQPPLLTKTKLDSLNIPALENKYKGYDAVYLDRTLEIDHALNPEWEYIVNFSVSYVVLNTESMPFTSFELENPWGYEVSNICLRATNPNGEYAEYSLKDCRLEKGSNGQDIYRFAYPNVVKGTIIQESYERMKKIGNGLIPPISDVVNLQYSVPILKQKYQISFPTEWEIQFKKNDNNKKITLFNMQEENKKKFVFMDSDIPGYKQESYSKSLMQSDKYIQWLFNEIYVYGFFDKLNYIGSETSLKAVYWKLERLSNSQGIMILNEVKDVTKQVTANCTTPYEKADSIIAYVQKNIKVVPSDNEYLFSVILKKKQANLLKVIGLTYKMLETVGLKPEFVMCHSVQDGSFDSKYFDESQFALPALMLIIDSKINIALPYQRYANFHSIPTELLGQQALLVRKESSFGYLPEDEFVKVNNASADSINLKSGTIFTLPDTNELENEIVENYDIIITQEGLLDISEQVEFYGDFAERFRYEFDEKKSEDLEKIIRNYLAFYDANIKLINWSIENQDNLSRPLTINYRYSVDNLVSVLPEEILFQTNGLLSPASISSFKVVPQDRQNPIYIPYNQNYVKKIKISYPAEWDLQTNLADSKVENKFGRFISSSKSDNKMISIEQIRSFYKSDAPKQDYPLLLKLSDEKSDAIIPTIIFSKKQ